MLLNFRVTHQRLILTTDLRRGCKSPVRDSNNYLELSFDFNSSEWGSLQKYCILTVDGGNYEFNLEDGNIILTNQFTSYSSFIVSCYGVDTTDDVLVTTNQYKVYLGRSGYTEDISPYEPIPSVDVVTDLYETKAERIHTHTVSNITDFPSIPSKLSDLENDSDFIETSDTVGLVKNDGSIDTTQYSTFDGDYTSLSNKPSIPSKTSDLTNDTGFITISSVPTKTSDLTNDSGFITDSALTGMLTGNDIVDDLTTGGSNKVLSAEQGKQLASQIGDAINYINE